MESLARKYARAVMEAITDPESERSLERGETLEDYIELRPLGLHLPNLIGIELEIDANLDQQGIAASGSYQIVPDEPEISYISVTISLPKPYNRRHLEMLYDELLEIMRHELEHAQQDPERIDAIADFSEDPFSSKQAMLDYFTSPEETAGWVTGWAKKAKKQKVPLEDLIRREVGYIVNQAKSEDLPDEESEAAGEELLKRFVSYALQRYPNKR